MSNRDSVTSESEEELDEFGRVKRRREKFKSERAEDRYDERSDSDHDRKEDRTKRRRHRSSSSSRRSRTRRYSEDSDSDYDRRHYRSTKHYRPHYSHRSNGRDPYSEAAQYIDTEFYPNKIYIGDLENVSTEQLTDAFSRFGELEDIRVVEGKDYAFATYVKEEAAMKAIQSMHGALVGARQIKVNRAKIPERNKVGFGNIPWQDEDGLMAKEAHNDDKDRPSSKPANYPSNPITSRVLTTYDDL
ncbi:hypothetical protein BY458DRAFT_535839 [Sporodiniella umbellata]|nr:hypothetical protein BY458DRAFT_535839 [Sporodiniella umbellata]